ncbi:hypothetical protein [Mycolicibacterium gadium]|uniref:Uncharacterized protein n=1 Tax=Mycolicibacterium gadium TaxID=1794 RepID=A0ABT6GJL7_MYCGU|nr:hypothetical protein [Mycolicibacterium gadium]MDG5481564.1 hypothetical protein [Mycolicibacterium gadium]
MLHRPVRLPPSGRHPAAPSAGPPRLPRPRLPMGVGVDLSPGVPDLSAFPRNLWLRTERAVLTETPPDELGYGTRAGTHVCARLSDPGSPAPVGCGPDPTTSSSFPRGPDG